MSVAEATPIEPDFLAGDRILKARRDKGWDQADLATAVGVSRQLVSKWERNVSLPDIAQAARVAEATNVSFGWLCGVEARSRCSAPTIDLTVIPGQNHEPDPDPTPTKPRHLRLV